METDLTKQFLWKAKTITVYPKSKRLRISLRCVAVCL